MTTSLPSGDTEQLTRTVAEWFGRLQVEDEGNQASCWPTREECAVAEDAAVTAGFEVIEVTGTRVRIERPGLTVFLHAPVTVGDLARSLAVSAFAADALLRAGLPLEHPGPVTVGAAIRLHAPSLGPLLESGHFQEVVAVLTENAVKARAALGFGQPFPATGPVDMLATLIADAADLRMEDEPGYPGSTAGVLAATLRRAPELLDVAVAADRPSRVTVPSRPAGDAAGRST